MCKKIYKLRANTLEKAYDKMGAQFKHREVYKMEH